MKSFDLGRYVLCACIVAALLAGCGGSQPPIGAPVTMQAGTIASARSAAHSLSVSYHQLFRFHQPVIDGSHPNAGLLDVNGTLYGTTANGGGGSGTVYRISTSGVEKVLHRFLGGADGISPESVLVDVNGTLYGTTRVGGGSGCSYGCGTVYRVSASGTEKVLYAFKGGSDGAYPIAGLIDVNGTLYGTTSEGGSSSPECNFSNISGSGPFLV
jgi:uncharacterized repeat protein (TIGR03803 family)